MKLLMLKGLPASGKTTYAKELVNKGWKRVNKDDLRSMIDDGQWSKKNEVSIVATQELTVQSLLSNGNNVVIDDTNFFEPHEKRWRELAEKYKATFEVKFFDVPVEECIARDAKRGDKSVGVTVIREMSKRYFNKDIAPVLPPNPDLPYCYIFDIDGTLAKMDGRSPYDWSKVHTDLPNEPIQRIMTSICANDAAHVFVVSGRDGSCRESTEQWLGAYGFNKGIEYDDLFMRPAGDMRKDVLIKQEIYEKEIKGKYNVIAVFDDRDQVVKFWRSIGLTCLQVAEGNF